MFVWQGEPDYDLFSQSSFSLIRQVLFVDLFYRENFLCWFVAALEHGGEAVAYFGDLLVSVIEREILSLLFKLLDPVVDDIEVFVI